MRARLPAFLLLAAVLVLAAPASAAAPWSAPETLPGSASAGTPTIEFGPEGHGLLSLGKFGSISEPGGSFGAPTQLVSGFFLFAERSSMALESGDRFLAVGYYSKAGRSGIAVVRGRLGGAIGKPRLIASQGAVRYAFAANSRGDAALLVQVSQRARLRSTRRRVYLLTRRAGAAFGPPLRIAGGGGPASLAVAINSRREVLALWGRNGAVAARRVTAAGKPARAEAVPSIEPMGYLGAALAPSGLAVVTGTTALGGESPPPRPGTYTLALAKRGGRFSSSELERTEVRGRSGYIGAVDLLATTDDTVLLGWTGQAGDRAAVKVAEVTGEGLGPVQQLSPAGADSHLVSIVPGPGGALMALWAQYEDTGSDFIAAERSSLVAAPRAAGAAVFGAPEEIAAPNLRIGNDLAIDPSGRAVATWQEQEGGRAVVKTATRPPAG